MEGLNKKNVLLRLFLLSRFLTNVSKKLDQEKIKIFIILALVEESPRTIKELAGLLTVNHSFMSAFISNMENQDLVKKQLIQTIDAKRSFWRRRASKYGNISVWKAVKYAMFYLKV